MMPVVTAILAAAYFLLIELENIIASADLDSENSYEPDAGAF